MEADERGMIDDGVKAGGMLLPVMKRNGIWSVFFG